jgi:hypothetical protein
MYEEEVLNVLEKQVPHIDNVYVEQNMNQSVGGMSTLGGVSGVV